MLHFFDIYNSFEDFFETLYRGNEIEFSYNGKSFFILPIFKDAHSVIGVTFGNAYSDKKVECFSKEDLYNIQIGNDLFGNIFDKIETTFYAF